jgi:hypothetical protein
MQCGCEESKTVRGAGAMLHSILRKRGALALVVRMDLQVATRVAMPGSSLLFSALLCSFDKLPRYLLPDFNNTTAICPSTHHQATATTHYPTESASYSSAQSLSSSSSSTK